MYDNFPIDPDSIIEPSPPAAMSRSELPSPTPTPEPESVCRCPTASASDPNDNYAVMLRSCFCGRDSELSSALCYLYQSMRFGCCASELCAILYDMAMRRIKAVKLLGDLICSLGSDPKFFCGKYGSSPAGSWWNASPTVLRYPQNLGDALLSAIRRENMMSEEYKNLIAYIDDSGVCHTLEMLRNEKQQDIQTLSILYSRFCS